VIHYPVPPHKQKHYLIIVFPITEKNDEVLSLPISPILTAEQVDFIIAILNGY
jgi:dTDP-4-amino-4,6-dideoxygalactose transaminase